MHPSHPPVEKGPRPCRFEDHPTGLLTPVHAFPQPGNWWTPSLGIAGRHPSEWWWTPSIGTAGRHQSVAVVAITRCAQLAVALDDLEGIGVPILAHDRHHVGVAREGDASYFSLTNGGEQTRLCAVGGRDAPTGDAVPRQIRLDELDKRNI